MVLSVSDWLLQSTYCKNVFEHCQSIGRTVHVVNLDPAADHFEYPVSIGEWFGNLVCESFWSFLSHGYVRM